MLKSKFNRMHNSTENKNEVPENEVPEILFQSILSQSKGVLILLLALRLLKTRNCSFHCTFIGGVGDISIESFHTHVEKWELCNEVVFLGKQFGISKNKAYSKADIFVFPSINKIDCFPLVMLEAMRASLPTVSTLDGEFSDLLTDGETGFLVPKQNVDALADKLEILLKSKTLRETMGKASRKKYEIHYTYHHFENRLLGILKQCVVNT